jgi:DNA-binding CsgD family transcriptional regulator
MNQRADFSERENDVIALLLTGKSNKQIAHALGISTRTVEFHLGNIYNKLQVNSRSEAILNLSSKHLWESTGISTGNNLREDTVEFRGQEGHNKGKPPLSKMETLDENTSLPWHWTARSTRDRYYINPW